MDTTGKILSINEALYRLILMILTLGQGVHSMPVPTDIPMCTASETAQYRLTFTGKWSQAAFPKQYPVYRPPAQWSNIIGESTASCLSLVTVLVEGVELCSDWVEYEEAKVENYIQKRRSPDWLEYQKNMAEMSLTECYWFVCPQRCNHLGNPPKILKNIKTQLDAVYINLR